MLARGHHDRLRLPVFVSLLHQIVGRGKEGGMGGGGRGMVERDGKRRKSWKEEEME